jgi:hypothetical protein
MKSSIFLLLALFTNSVFAQLSFPAGNFTPLPGTTMQTLPDSYSGDLYLSFDRPVPTDYKGFSLNMMGSTRTDLDIDVPVYSESSMSSNFQVSFPGRATLSVNRNMEAGYASLSYTVPPDPEHPEFPVPLEPVTIAVYDEAGMPNMFTVFPGTIGSLMLIPVPVIPEPGESPVMAPYLLAMNVKPDNSRTLLELHFHDKTAFSIGSTTITGKRMDLWINAPYSSLPSVTVSASGIAAPVSVSYYEWQTMPPFLSMPASTNVYTTDEVLFTGINLDYVDAVTFNGLPLTFDITGSSSLNVLMPELPGSGQLTLLSEHGDHVSSFMLNVTDKPECSKVPDPHSLFFYPATTSSMSLVYTWNYNGNPSATFDVEYREVGAPGWNTANTGSTREFVVTNAIPGTDYEFRVRALCPNLLISDWSEEKVISVVYTDEIDVSEELNGALRIWREDTTRYFPMDSFLTTFTGPFTFDPREVVGFVDRFFGSTPGFPSIMSVGDCVCKKVIVDLAIVRDNTAPKVMPDEAHKQHDFMVGKKLQWYKYFGASQRNSLFARDFESWCDDYGHKKNNRRRHTERDNMIQLARTVGDSPYKYTNAFTTLSMSYICANKVSRLISFCGCEKKVYVTAESKVEICAAAENGPRCDGHKRSHDAGFRAEAGFGSIIFTGLLSNNPSRVLDNIDVLGAGYYNVYRESNYASTLNPDFVKKAISLIYNAGVATALAATVGGGAADVIANLINQGYMSKAKDDLIDLVGIKMYNITYENFNNGEKCREYSVTALTDPFYIVLYPNQERHVTIATTSYSGLKAWGCRYTIKAGMNASHHLAAATDRLKSSENPECCLIPTAAYSAYSISEGCDEQPADNGHKQAMGTLFYLHGDIEDNPGSVFDFPYWLDTKKNRVSFDEDNTVVTPWITPGGTYTTHGRMQGYPYGCNVDSMPSPSQPLTGLGSKSVTKEKTTLSVYPNTAHNSTNIDYTLSASSNITLTIYDMTGRKVAVLTDNEKMESGTHHVEADLSKLARGQYIVLLTSNNMNAYQYLVKE